jgi:hypothetical protein
MPKITDVRIGSGLQTTDRETLLTMKQETADLL